jgi:hypothetical protein
MQMRAHDHLRAVTASCTGTTYIDANMNRGGLDLSQTFYPPANASISFCVADCCGLPQCAAWVYAPPGVSQANAVCFRKSGIPTPSTTSCPGCSAGLPNRLLTTAVWFDVTAYGFDLSDGSGVGWNSGYPEPSFDDDPARLGQPNAKWSGRTFAAGSSQFCSAHRNLTAPNAPGNTLQAGHTVKLMGASYFSQPALSRTFVLATFSGVPSVAVATAEACVSFYYLSCPALAAPAQGTVSYNASAPYYYRTVATFACNSGFTLSGTATAVCDVATYGAAAPTDAMNLRFAFDSSAANTGTSASAVTTFGAPSYTTVDSAPSVFFNNPNMPSQMSTNYYRASTGLTSGAGWTIATWVYPITTYSQTIIGLRNEIGENGVVSYVAGFQMDLHTDNSIWLYTSAPDTWRINPSTAAGAVRNNTWTHIAYTFSASFVGTLYVDGTQVSQATGAGPVPGYTRLVIGGAGDAARGYYGSLSDVRLYSRVLTAAEVGTVRAKYAGSWTASNPVCTGVRRAGVAQVRLLTMLTLARSIDRMRVAQHCQLHRPHHCPRRCRPSRRPRCRVSLRHHCPR